MYTLYESPHKEKIIELSKYGNILHKYTAFVGVSNTPNEFGVGTGGFENYHLSNSSLASLHDSIGSNFAIADSIDDDVVVYGLSDDCEYDQFESQYDIYCGGNSIAPIQDLPKEPNTHKMIHNELIQLANPIIGSWKCSDEVWALLSQYNNVITKSNLAEVCGNFEFEVRDYFFFSLKIPKRCRTQHT